MGVGYPLDLVVCVALGVDMFDCVYPTRTARFGVALVDIGTMRLKSKEFGNQLIPVDLNCSCSTCKSYTRAILHVMFKENNALAAQLLTIHNIAYMMRLMRSMREAIMNGKEVYHQYIRNFLKNHFPSTDIPVWVINALATVGLHLENTHITVITETTESIVGSKRSREEEENDSL